MGKPLTERKALIKEYKICYKCCPTKDHVAKECKATVKHCECQSNKHPTALHPRNVTEASPSQPTTSSSPTEKKPVEAKGQGQTALCTQVCGKVSRQRTCHQICLDKVFPAGRPEQAERMYVILDGQSTRALASPEFFDLFNWHGEETHYTITTCSRMLRLAGRTAVGFQIDPYSRCGIASPSSAAHRTLATQAGPRSKDPAPAGCRCF